jgi:hypothetical protein
MKTKMTIILTETGAMTAGVLECACVQRAITKTREAIERSDAEIAATKLRLNQGGGKLKRIQLSRKKGWRLPANAVVVSRPSQWGNPFVVNPKQAGQPEHPEACFDRAEAVKMFEASLLHGGVNSDLIKILRHDLRGKDLACWCPLGQPCHADVLLKIANG